MARKRDLETGSPDLIREDARVRQPQVPTLLLHALPAGQMNDCIIIQPQSNNLLIYDLDQVVHASMNRRSVVPKVVFFKGSLSWVKVSVSGPSALFAAGGIVHAIVQTPMGAFTTIPVADTNTLPARLEVRCVAVLLPWVWIVLQDHIILQGTGPESRIRHVFSHIGTPHYPVSQMQFIMIETHSYPALVAAYSPTTYFIAWLYPNQPPALLAGVSPVLGAVGVDIRQPEWPRLAPAEASRIGLLDECAAFPLPPLRAVQQPAVLIDDTEAAEADPELDAELECLMDRLNSIYIQSGRTNPAPLPLDDQTVTHLSGLPNLTVWLSGGSVLGIDFIRNSEAVLDSAVRLADTIEIIPAPGNPIERICATLDKKCELQVQNTNGRVLFGKVNGDPLGIKLHPWYLTLKSEYGNAYIPF